MPVRSGQPHDRVRTRIMLEHRMGREKRKQKKEERRKDGMNNGRDENAAGDDCGARERKWENDDHLRTFGAFMQGWPSDIL